MFEDILSFADEHRMPVLNHHWGAKLEEWVQAYPHVQFITGHWDPARSSLVKQYDNLWVCTCLPIAHESFERGMRDLRSDRVMWGSDMSDLQFGVGLGPILLARVSDEVKRRVIGLNMLELLGTCGVPVPSPWD
jgi:predicted TIM-barrel fold metal-dependent hydrolase